MAREGKSVLGQQEFVSPQADVEYVEDEGLRITPRKKWNKYRIRPPAKSSNSFKVNILFPGEEMLNEEVIGLYRLYWGSKLGLPEKKREFVFDFDD